MLAHLANCVHIWSLLVGLTKCAAHLGKRAAQLAKRVRNLPNVDQLVKCAVHLAKCADWSNAPYKDTSIVVIKDKDLRSEDKDNDLVSYLFLSYL